MFSQNFTAGSWRDAFPAVCYLWIFNWAESCSLWGRKLLPTHFFINSSLFGCTVNTHQLLQRWMLAVLLNRCFHVTENSPSSHYISHISERFIYWCAVFVSDLERTTNWEKSPCSAGRKKSSLLLQDVWTVTDEKVTDINSKIIVEFTNKIKSVFDHEKRCGAVFLRARLHTSVKLQDLRPVPTAGGDNEPGNNNEPTTAGKKKTVDVNKICCEMLHSFA